MKARELYRSLAYLGRSQQNWAFSHLSGKDYGQVYLDDPDIEVDEARLGEIKEAYLSGRPLAYILEEAYFFGRKFYVNDQVLIPRPETEGLVERALELEWNRALDLCTGSGVIALSLAQERPGADISAIDISPGALEVARKNAGDMGLDVDFTLSDLYQQVEGDYDLIISNPPYIKTNELKDLEVAGQEPLLALDGGPQGLDLYKRIFAGAKEHLRPGGHLLLEIGDEQGEDILRLSQGFCGRIERDLAGKVRYYLGRRKDVKR